MTKFINKIKNSLMTISKLNLVDLIILVILLDTSIVIINLIITFIF